MYRNSQKDYLRSIVPLVITSIVCLVIFWLWLRFEIAKDGSSQLQFAGIDQPKKDTLIRQILTGSLILSPTLLMIIYCRCKLLTKYIIRQIMAPFSYSLAGFIAIWLIIDLSDNGPDLAKAGASLLGTAKFYLVQIPQIIVTILPITLLLSTLYSLGKLSKNNEIISMVSSGLSLNKILAPIFFIGLYCSLVSLTLNYEWAPEAESHKETVLMSFDKVDTQSQNKQYKLNSRLYRNREKHRTWFIGSMPPNLASAKLRNVEIYQSNENGQLIKSFYANQAKWNHSDSSWQLLNGVIIQFNKNSEEIFQQKFQNHIINDWNETPWEIYSGNPTPEALGISGLSFHLKSNSEKSAKSLAAFRTHWHYRWALPLSCLVITLIASPLGIISSRQNLTSSATAAMIIFFLMLLLTNLFLALAQGMKVPPPIGAWSTNIIIASIGMILLISRQNNNHLSITNYLKRAYARLLNRQQKRTTSRLSS
ncbi:MAG: LptF/LptG family permease [Verrucomicrobiota bacterium]|nr:LptF/LptG family permease [Verrucomicrobiota bacterium]